MDEIVYLNRFSLLLRVLGVYVNEVLLYFVVILWLAMLQYDFNCRTSFQKLLKTLFTDFRRL